ncbi:MULTISPECIES: cytochrome c maturation protein CcmE [unclassified Leclercia]|uniref:Cytochrome c-type biogenesis protein CcmE n=1 Tax=Leclercia barmai TaxID=2785629 RepID=A0ABS7RZ10_9ENTR|nr:MULTISPECIES: cytochrome c maturation protein CcmE [unclassified Leclercia]MBZ0059546.1 cytochrome c maturation protein CcmE [Leclercia sp. EMC7]MCM5697320.1 cytochrome c maturation protein CcmE [Leclercia sp. LTM01]MCM5702082.1 cytochrome c maturation protein CcmE [Leclercia sp. LTM14]
MNTRRKNRLLVACLLVSGLVVTVGLILYALRANIDLFYTPGEVLYGKGENREIPVARQRLRVGGLVLPGSIKRSATSMQVNFTLYDDRGRVQVTFDGLLPDLFREGQGIVVQGELASGNHIIAREVLAKHDENYTPPGVKKGVTFSSTTRTRRNDA